jgi:chitinase
MENTMEQPRPSRPLTVCLWLLIAGGCSGLVAGVPSGKGEQGEPDGGAPTGPPGPGPDAAAPRLDAAPDKGPVDAPPPAPGCGLANVVTRAFFDAIFPAGGRNPSFTYDGLIRAAQAFPEFVGSGDLDTCRKEAAAFLANVSHETGNLRFAEQIAKERYCQPQGGCPCDPAGTDQAKWYYGRGALQLSWNYNYCAAGTALGADLVGTPSLVSSNPDLAWKTGVWFWMRGGAGRSCHSAMLPGGGGFGATIRTINGGIECGKGGYGVQDGVTQRVMRYIDYARRLGIADPGTPQSNGC